MTSESKYLPFSDNSRAKIGTTRPLSLSQPKSSSSPTPFENFEEDEDLEQQHLEDELKAQTLNDQKLALSLQKAELNLATHPLQKSISYLTNGRSHGGVSRLRGRSLGTSASSYKSSYSSAGSGRVDGDKKLLVDFNGNVGYTPPYMDTDANSRSGIDMRSILKAEPKGCTAASLDSLVDGGSGGGSKGEVDEVDEELTRDLEDMRNRMARVEVERKKREMSMSGRRR